MTADLPDWGPSTESPRFLPFTTFIFLSSVTCVLKAAGRSPQIINEKQGRKSDVPDHAYARGVFQLVFQRKSKSKFNDKNQ